MAWVATDDIDSYAAGTGMDAEAGGTDWTGNWSWRLSVGTEPTAETAPAGGQGGRAIKFVSTTNNTVLGRALTALSAGTTKFRIRSSIANPNDNTAVTLASDLDSSHMYVRLGPTGNIEIFNSGTGYESLGAYSADTWYLIDFDFDDAAQDNKYRARVNGGTWSDWKNTNGTYVTIAAVRIECSKTNAGDFWVDDIGEGSTGDPGGGTVLPTGIATSEAFGTSRLNSTLFPSSVASGEAVGSLALVTGIAPTGIATSEAFGTSQLNAAIAPAGISPEEAFGNALLAAFLNPDGIASAEAFGTTLLVGQISPTGVASAEAFGTAVLIGAGTISPDGIASTEVFGIAVFLATTFPSGISSGEAFGSASILGIISPAGISSGEVFGTLLLIAQISPVGIASAEAFGTATLSILAGTYSEEMVHASLMDHFATNFSASSSLSLDEQPFDYESATEAVGFDAVIMDDDTRRNNSLQFNRLEIIANCWAKPGANSYRAEELADAVYDLYNQADIPVYDFDTAGNPQVGGIRLSEAEIIDRTFEMNVVHKVPGRHILVRIPGHSQEI